MGEYGVDVSICVCVKMRFVFCVRAFLDLGLSILVY